MSASRDKLNAAALARLLGGRPPPPELDRPLAIAAAGAGGGEEVSRVFTGAVPTDWTGTPAGHDGRMMRVTWGGGTWGLLVEIYSVTEGVETVHKTFDCAPAFTKVCIAGEETYRCVWADPVTLATA